MFAVIDITENTCHKNDERFHMSNMTVFVGGNISVFRNVDLENRTKKRYTGKISVLF